MKPKITMGTSFSGTVTYILQEKKIPEKISGNVFAEGVKNISEEFQAVQSLRPDIEKPCWHCSLSLPADEEKLHQEYWKKVLDQFFEKMKITDKHQYVAFRHQDREHDHIHIVVNRISTEGKIWKHRNDVKRAIKACQEIERDCYFLTETKGLSTEDVLKDPSYKRSEIEKALREKKRPLKKLISDEIKEVVKDNPSIEIFVERLRDRGIRSKPNISKSGHMNGFSFVMPFEEKDKDGDQIAFKGSQVGAKWGALEKEVVFENDMERKNQRTRFLREIKSDSSSFWDCFREQNSSRNDSKNSIPVGRSSKKGTETDRNISGNGSGISTKGKNRFSGGSKHREDVFRDLSDPLREDRRREAIFEVEEGNPDMGLSGRDCDWVSVSDSIDRLALDEENSDNTNTKNGVDKNMTKKSVAYKQQVWMKQAQALGSEKYRITLRDRTGSDKAWNIGKGKGENEEEKLWTAADVKKKIAFLEAQNVRGNDIYVTPVDEKFHFILLDDLHKSGLKKLKEKGYKPCWVAYSSEDNYQAILKVPAERKTKREQSMANYVMRKLNNAFDGDKSITAVIHPFRMAGQHNKKKNKNNVQTKIEMASSCICNKTSLLLQEVRENFSEIEKETEKKIQKTKHIDIDPGEGMTSLDKKFVKNFKMWQGLAKKNKWKEDISIMDFRTCVTLLEEEKDLKDEEIAKALLKCSPGLANRHKDVQIYVERTIENARKKVLEKQKQKNVQCFER